MIDLDELERLEKAATPAPWSEPTDDWEWDLFGKDSAMICPMRNALPALLECTRVLKDIYEDKDWSYYTETRAREALAKLRGKDE